MFAFPRAETHGLQLLGYFRCTSFPIILGVQLQAKARGSPCASWQKPRRRCTCQPKQQRERASCRKTWADSALSALPPLHDVLVNVHSVCEADWTRLSETIICLALLTRYLLEEIASGGCIDSTHQPLFLTLMALTTEDVSKLRVGKLTAQSITTLRALKTFINVKYVLIQHLPTYIVRETCFNDHRHQQTANVYSARTDL